MNYWGNAMEKQTAIAVPRTKPIGAEAARIQPKPSVKARDFKRNNLVGYLFISPWLICFLLFAFIPIAISLWLAFTDYDILSPASGQFIGLDNFQRMFFEDVRYGRSVSAT